MQEDLLVDSTSTSCLVRPRRQLSNSNSNSSTTTKARRHRQCPVAAIPCRLTVTTLKDVLFKVVNRALRRISLKRDCHHDKDKDKEARQADDPRLVALVALDRRP